MSKLGYDEKANKSFEPLPVGVYSGFISDAEFTHSKTSNKPMYKVTFTVIEGPDGGENPTQCKGRKVFENFMADVQWRMNSLYRCCKAAKLEDQYFDDFETNVVRLVNKQLKFRLATTTDQNGKLTNKIEGENYYEWATGDAIPASFVPALPPNGTASADLPFKL